MRFPPFFHADKRGASMDSKQKRSKPKLDRRNAVKNIDYDASSWYSSFALRTRSLEEVPTQTSFRVDGADGEIDRICRTLGISGPDDLAIPVAAWEARKARSSSDLLPRSRLNLPPDSPAGDEKDQGRHHEGGYLDLCTEFGTRVNIGDVTPASAPCVNEEDSNRGFAKARDCSFSVIDGLSNSNASGGIKGVRPPALAPPPAMSLPVLDKMCSTWDIMRSLAPAAVDRFVPSKVCEEEDEEFGTWDDYGRMAGLGDTADMAGSCSFSTSNDDDSSSTTTEGMFVSPNGKIKRNIRSWIRGTLLGSGSFGTVYEGISDDGFFFAIKEVSLLDQGSKAQQCILQLEQEIALLSQFEHENIVQYLGTDKEEAKLYIFLELVTQGSLASLYQRYNLQDSQVSAYTRQILNGLSYLHDRNVLHRDIKCANILVDASGSVKLADFGLAKETSKINKLKSCKGSAYWMAPEVVNPRKTYGLPADIWSLGCTVLEMLTRQLPYSNLEWTQALFKIGKGEPPSIPKTLSKDAQDFIHQCLRVEPDNRPSASELLEHPFLRRPLPAFSGSGSPYNKRRL